VGQVLVGCIVLTIVAGVIVRRTVTRLRDSLRPWRWNGRCDMSPVAEYAICTFFLCVGLFLLTENVIWVGVLLIAWQVGYFAERADWRRFHRQEDALRKANAAYHPGIFEQTPPQDINAFCEEEFRLFDTGACTYLGNVPRQDLQKLIEWRSLSPDLGPNDIYFLEEDLELSKELGISPEFLELVSNGFQSRDYVILRWMPQAH